MRNDLLRDRQQLAQELECRERRSREDYDYKLDLERFSLPLLVTALPAFPIWRRVSKQRVRVTLTPFAKLFIKFHKRI